jgi:hypothetical protein
MRAAGVWVLLVTAACGRIAFDPLGGGAGDDSPFGDGDGGTGGDGDGGTSSDGSSSTSGDSGGVADADPATSCIAPGNGTAFPGGFPCTGWSGASQVANNAGLQQSGGYLQVNPNASSPNARGGCFNQNLAFGSGGAHVEVSAVLASPSGVTAFDVTSFSGADFGMRVNGGMLRAFTDTTQNVAVAYDGTAMRWWRIRPLGGGVVFEVAPDAMSWSAIGTSTATPSPSVTLDVSGAASNEPTPGFARFEGVNVCP